MARPATSCGRRSVAKKGIESCSLPFPAYPNEFSSSLFMLSCSDYMNNPSGESRRVHDWTQMTAVFVSAHQGTFRLGSTALDCSEQGTSKAYLFLRGTS